MVKYVDCGLYNVDLEGETDGEYDENHPTLIIQTAKESNMYFVIPFTTYTDKRWNKMKKYMCCRVKSTNSIARIDKMEVINDLHIGERWVSNKEILQPSPDEIKNVLKYAITYLQVSCDKANKSYDKYFSEYEFLLKNVTDIFINENIMNNKIFKINFDKANLFCDFSMKFVTKLSKSDIQNIFDHPFKRKFLMVVIDNKNYVVHIIVSIYDKKVLTLKSKYDKLMVTEG
jgi:hypothetical protein